MRNRYAITQKPDGWWLVLNEPCMTHIIGRAAQEKHIAVMHSLEAFIEELQSEIEMVKNDPACADELIAAMYVRVLPLVCVYETDEDED